MAQLPREEVDFTDFGGIATNVSPQETPPGTGQDQNNACCIRLNELITRKGLWELTFED